jgi:hypothetical protein
MHETELIKLSADAGLVIQHKRNHTKLEVLQARAIETLVAEVRLLNKDYVALQGFATVLLSEASDQYDDKAAADEVAEFRQWHARLRSALEGLAQ